ncbi:MAG: hypothetical protein WDM79_15885 [Terricaulis sp.]
MADGPKTNIESGGDYSDARDDDKAVKGFVQRSKSQIDSWAEHAERALEDDERDAAAESETNSTTPARD